VRRLHLCLVALACLLPSVSLASEAPPKMTAGSPELLDRRLIDIGGGQRLNMVCIGKGAPTLVFEQALGGTILDWQYIQADLSKTNRTCFYDRAGYGQAVASRRPRESRAERASARPGLPSFRSLGDVLAIGRGLSLENA